MKAQLILGCHGARRYGFSLCRGVSNPIVDLRKLGDDKEKILTYLDDHCKLFDTVAEDKNMVHAVINFVDQHKLTPKHVMDTIYEFVAQHKNCGLYCFIEPTE